MSSIRFVILAALLGLPFPGQGAPPAEAVSAGAAAGARLPENFRPFTARIFCGAQPEGDNAFRALRDAGIGLVLSVDGATPDVAAAQRQGIRYVHLPFGYDGVPPTVVAALAQVVSTSPGKIFIHCHHGKHRGPAAAAIAGLFEGSLDQAGALHLLEAAGTGREYEGLWRDVREFHGVPEGVVPAPIVETAPVPDLVSAMVEADDVASRLKDLLGVADEQALSEAARQAVLLREAFLEMVRLEEAAPLRPGLLEASDLATGLREAIATNPRSAMVSLDRIRAKCAECHRSERNNRSSGIPIHVFTKLSPTAP
ncbi:MAG: hypothetical protein KGS60_19020 [Verrucomicrobia bacterium]|nr:hypothetical protein [Verrucomicrobiota bacterium]